MSNFRISNRVEFVQYCLRQLGAPVIKVNITEEQVDDRINDALYLFTQHHMDGSYKRVYPHTITQNDIDSKSILLTGNIVAVLGVYLPTDNTVSIGSMNNLQQVSYFTDMVQRSVSGNISSYVVSQSYFGSLNSVMPNVEKITSYNIYNNKLHVELQWNKRNVGDVVGIECYKYDDIDDVGFVYNDYWLKQYATALIKKQWGTNLVKFSGYTLVGEGQLNGQGILDSANEEIRDLEAKLFEQFSYPIDAFMY